MEDNDLGNLNYTSRSRHNTLGLSKTDYSKYKLKLIREYEKDESLTLRGISRREKKKGYELHPDRLRRWIVAAGVEIRSANIARRKYQDTGETCTFYLRKDQATRIKEFKNSSELVQVAIDMILGFPINSVILFLDKKKNVIFSERNGEIKYQVTSKLTNEERKNITALAEVAKKKGLFWVERFATENKMKFYSSNNFVQDHS